MNTNFQYKDIDEEGKEILDVIASAKDFNNWMFQTIRPHCTGKILEIGSGTGNISEFFIRNGDNISLSDIREDYCNILSKKFSNIPNVNGIYKLDLVHEKFTEVYKDLLGTFNTVFALNVVEHIENHELAISNCKKLLVQEGTLIILVPAYEFLYNHFDKELYHYRRYNKTLLSNIFEKEGFEIKKSFYFNAAGILGWYFSGKIQKNKIIPKKQMLIYEKFVPLFKILDHILLNKIGLSVVCVGKNTLK